MKYLAWLFVGGILISSLLPSIYAPPANDDQEYWPPFTSKKHPYGTPLYQLRGGVAPENIRCDPSLVLVIKHNGDPACVKQETGKKLLERGWIKCTGRSIEEERHPCGQHSSGAKSSGPPKVFLSKTSDEWKTIPQEQLTHTIKNTKTVFS